ncbi:transposase [Bacillus salitolerans]|uniref:Mutator family transposase n=1 Tax=Bacillus salitolerans TaxID=1437434 RepID=A0ABW4LNE3_9BACI
MENEREDYLCAGSYERTMNRNDYRNGYDERDFLVSIGKIKLTDPRTRNGQFSTSVFEKYQRADQSLVLSMMEMVVYGVSTRKVTNMLTIKKCKLLIKSEKLPIMPLFDQKNYKTFIIIRKSVKKIKDIKKLCKIIHKILKINRIWSITPPNNRPKSCIIGIPV